MNINHIALWAEDIELIKEFYIRHFGAVAGARYHNPNKKLTSYFLTFPDGDVTLEIMNIPGIISRRFPASYKGLCHFAISVGSKEAVDEFTGKMQSCGVTVLGNPRVTGDGFYESIISDPEGNIIELTI